MLPSATPIELLGYSAHVVVGMMRLQPACQQLKHPMHAVDAVGAWHIPRMLPPSLVRNGSARWHGRGMDRVHGRLELLAGRL